MENSREMPDGVGFVARSVATAAARSAVIGSSIVAAGSSIAVISWGWEVKSWWWRREGGTKERGKVKARGRPNRRRAEAATAGWVRQL
nr:hypothetical protein CFP56_46935 [Quercus suber]